MPKLEVETTIEDGVIGTSYNEYGYRVSDEATTPTEIRKAFAKASPKEREQIRAFITANTASKVIGKLYRYYFLRRVKNLDTGKTFLAAGCKSKSPGLLAKDIKKITGAE